MMHQRLFIKREKQQNLEQFEGSAADEPRLKDPLEKSD